MNWIDVIDFFKSEQFVDLVDYIDRQEDILPARNNVFRVFRETSFEQVKVVILGQDPYPNKEHACGLAFAVPPGTSPLPASLQNIKRELIDDVGLDHELDLEQWAKQGVLLLNTCLTVQPGKPGSHSNIGWNTLTTQVIRELSDRRENLVYILWGKHAQKYMQLIDSKKHCIISSSHPSPLSSYRGFFGSKPFSKTNTFLTSKQIPAIVW